MDSEADALATLRQYTIAGIEYTGKEIGRGSYAVVLEMKYHGLLCAGKKLGLGLHGQKIVETARRFAGECRMLSQLRHPNIVQFLGVHFESRASRVPVLVMEYLPMTLTQRLEKNGELGALPDEMIYSVLADVALGLNYLHGHIPPIVHRDLSANNVLLSRNLTAKISDLSVAKILHLSPQELSRMTKAPGNICYMPPEALEDNPQYGTSVDAFSYGILLMHVFSGKWPYPTKAVTVDPKNADKIVAVSEAQRRQQYLDEISPDNPLMNLILRCIKNNPTSRPNAAEILRRMNEVQAGFAPVNKEELLHRAKALSVSIKELQKETKSNSVKKAEPENIKSKKKTEHSAQTKSSKDKIPLHSTSAPDKAGNLQEYLTSTQVLHSSLQVDTERALENITQIKDARLSEDGNYARLEQEKERMQEIVIKTEKRQESLESLRESLKEREQRDQARVVKLQEAMNKAQELCENLRQYIKLKDNMLREFQETQLKLHQLVVEAFQP